MRHEECPCCRLNYLSLEGDDIEEGQSTLPALQPDSSSVQASPPFLRGAHLFHLLSQLQTLADDRPNTTIRLEGVELPNGRRGNFDIQRSTGRSALRIGGRGLNIRVTSDESDSSTRNSTSPMTILETEVASNDTDLLHDPQEQVTSNGSRSDDSGDIETQHQRG